MRKIVASTLHILRIVAWTPTMDYSLQRTLTIQGMTLAVFSLTGLFMGGPQGFAIGALAYFTFQIAAIAAFVFVLLLHHAYKQPTQEE